MDLQPVVGYEDRYLVSDTGEVWSIRANRKMALQPCSESGYRRRGSYLQVTLTKDGVKRTHLVHVLVLEAFVGPRPEGHEGCHGLGGSLDNSVANLRWDTPCENRLDTTRHGHHHNANKTHCKREHPLSGDNLMTQRRVRKNGTVYYARKCKTCLHASPSRNRRAA